MMNYWNTKDKSMDELIMLHEMVIKAYNEQVSKRMELEDQVKRLKEERTMLLDEVMKWKVEAQSLLDQQ